MRAIAAELGRAPSTISRELTRDRPPQQARPRSRTAGYAPRLFPAWLHTHLTDRDSYARLKQSLRETGTWGHDYTAAKAACVNRVSGLAAASSASPEP